jgi:hypothetical protein
MALLAVILAALVVWAHPWPAEDLYVGLAGGRDIAQGKLGRMDDWSFLTEGRGRVWIDQNWLMHWACYRVYQVSGEAGLLASKAALVALVCLGLILVCRQRGCGLGSALLTAAGIVLAAKAYVDLRPNLATLTLAPWLLLVLLKSRRQAHWAWLSVPLILLWANLHGGFVFGLGMLGLWTACHFVSFWFKQGPPEALRRCWPLAAATLAAIAVAGLANPFGMQNLTHAFIVGRSSVWREVLEWRSMFDPQGLGLAFHWPFLALVGVTLVLGICRLAARARGRARGRQPMPGLAPEALAAAIFEPLFFALVVCMAVAAQRFSPLAMLMAAPLLARQIQWLLDKVRRAWLLPALCVLVMAPTLCLGVRVARHYSANNPMAQRESFFGRMVYDSVVDPAYLAQFINENSIGGRLFQEWSWEGYLRWKCSSAIKLWIGARAQQVYTEAQYLELMDVLSQEDQVAARLRKLDIHLVAMPMTKPLGQFLVSVLAYHNEGTWAIIYFDGINVLLADDEHPATRALIDAAVEGRLKWPSENLGLLSRGICLSCKPVRRRLGDEPARALLRQSVARQASPLQMSVLMSLSKGPGGRLEESDAQFLADQYNRYAAARQPQPRGSMIVSMCSEIAEALAGHYRQSNRLVEAQHWAREARARQDQMHAMERRWAIQ